MIAFRIWKKMKIFGTCVPSVSYYLAPIIWLTAFYRQDSEIDGPPLSSEQMADEVRQYIRILKGLLGKSKDDDATPPDVSSGQMADEVRQ